MSFIALIITVVAIVLLITGGLVESLNFLIWVGMFLFVIAVITFLLRSIRGGR